MNFLKKEIVFIIILIISVFAIYSKSISFDFVGLDDNLLISDNINYISNIKNIPQFFVNSCYYSNDYLYYRPILNLSFAIEAILFRDNPKIYHLMNIILFILSIYLMYVFLVKLKLNKNILKCMVLLISVHPIFSSAVVWIPARNDTLLIIFLMVSLINLINYLQQKKSKYLILYTLFFAISLFTKETAIILIPVYILIISVFNYKITRKQIIENGLIFLSILVIYFVLRNISVPGISIKEYIINWQQYILNTFKGTMIYIDKFIMVEYIPVMLYKIKIGIKSVIINITIISLLIFLLYKKIIDRRIIIFGLIWFIICLLPTFLQFEYVLLQHRFLLPSLGIILILTACIKEIINRYPISKRYLFSLFVILFLTYSYGSYIQADKYKNSDVFWVNAYLDSPNYHLTCEGLSKIYFNNGEFKKSEFLIKRALSYKCTNRYLITYATILFAEGNIDESEKIYLSLSNEIGKSKYLVCMPLSRIYLMKKDNIKALEYAKEAFDLQPNNIMCSENLATIYAINKQYSKAIELYQTLLDFDENNNKYKSKINLLYTKLNNKENINE